MTSKNKLISVITVTYNAAKVLEATIQSVLGQTYQPIEYIIIDGASIDGTGELIKKYESQLAYWISEQDQGVYDAMNKALKAAKGEWIYFLGAGDILYPVLDQIGPRLTDPHTIYYGDVYREDLASIYGGFFSSFRFAVNNICHQAIFYPKAVFEDYRYDLRYKIQADYALNMRCYGDTKYAFAHLPVTICAYEGGGYSDQQLDLVFFKDKIGLIRANFPSPAYAYASLRRLAAKLFKAPYDQVRKEEGK